MKKTNIQGVLKTEIGALVTSGKNNPCYEQYLREKNIHQRVSGLETKLDSIESILSELSELIGIKGKNG